MSGSSLYVLDEDRHCQFLHENGVHVVTGEERRRIAPVKKLLALVDADRLPDVAEVLKSKNQKNHLKALLIHQEKDLEFSPAFLDRAGLRSLRRTLFHTSEEVPRRVVNAWRLQAQDDLIASASLQDDLLFVWNCALERFEIPIQDIPALEGLSPEEQEEFEVEEEGDFIHWPRPDIHLDLVSLRVVVEPELKAKFQRKKLAHNQEFGKAVRRLREEAGLRQKDIPSLSTRQVRRVEQGESQPRSSTLRNFAEAHDLELGEYLDRVTTFMDREDE